jgi:hypothetical protein
MRNPISKTKTISEMPTASVQFPKIAFAAAAAMFCAQALVAVPLLAAQTPAAPPATHPTQKTTHPKPHAGKAHHTDAQAAAVPEAPKAPGAPKWPANDQPAQASVVWDSQGLRIDASNSSLQQILKDVETATGAEVEGLGDDERVFGAYGPGLARDVLSQLLHGSDYNVLMIGDLGKGAPRQIVLSSRKPGDAKNPADKAGASSGDEDAPEPEADEQPQQPVPQPNRPAFGPGGPPRTPQQIMQEMQQRQQQGIPPRPQ